VPLLRLLVFLGLFVLDLWVQATESESWRTKPISRPCSGLSYKNRTVKTACVLRPLECMDPAGWRLLTVDDRTAVTTQIEMILMNT